MLGNDAQPILILKSQSGIKLKRRKLDAGNDARGDRSTFPDLKVSGIKLRRRKLDASNDACDDRSTSPDLKVSRIKLSR